MLKNIIYCSVILIIFSISCVYIYNSNKIINKISINTPKTIAEKPIKKYEKLVEEEKPIEEEKQIGKLIIPKINLEKALYSIDSSHNNIEENVTILDGSITPENNNSIIFIAAHSGTGYKAFFNNLDKLNVQDQIILEYNNLVYKYEITAIWETNKDGDIEVQKTDNKQLVLTTCSQSNIHKQLIINSILKEP